MGYRIRFRQQNRELDYFLAHSGLDRQEHRCENDFLIHFGIKGQRWGIRRYQNEDGTLTEEGMRRYGITDSGGRLNPSAKVIGDYQIRKANDSSFSQQLKNEKAQGKPISKRRQELINQYRQKGLTQEQAETEALRTEQTEKLIKVAGAVALTAVVAYGAYKGHQWLSKNMDKKIKAGSELYRTTRTPATELKDRAGYVATNRKDVPKYNGVYGQQIRAERGLNPYAMTGNATKNIKVAGDRKANKVYRELLKNDKQFAADNERVRKTWEGLGQNGTNSYADFNARLVDHQTQEAARVQEKFYNALKEKGYGGVIDVNDRDFSHFHAKNPTILFNLKESISNIRVNELSDEMVNKSAERARNLMVKQAVRDATVDSDMKTVRNYGIFYTGTFFGVGAAANRYRKGATDRSAAYQKSIVKQYRKEHPASKLNDAQILENVLGDSYKQ